MKITLNGVYCRFNGEYPEGLLFDVPSSNIQRIFPATININEHIRGDSRPTAKTLHTSTCFLFLRIDSVSPHREAEAPTRQTSVFAAFEF